MAKADGRKMVKFNGVFPYKLREVSRQRIINYFLDTG